MNNSTSYTWQNSEYTAKMKKRKVKNNELWQKMTAQSTEKCVIKRDNYEMKKEIIKNEKDDEQKQRLDLK